MDPSGERYLRALQHSFRGAYTWSTARRLQINGAETIDLWVESADRQRFRRTASVGGPMLRLRLWLARRDLMRRARHHEKAIATARSLLGQRVSRS